MGTALGPTALRWGHRGDPWLWEGDRAASGSAALTQQTCSTQQVTGERQHSFRRGESEVSPYPKPVRKAPQELLQQHRAAGRVELGAPQAFVSESSSCGCRVQLAGMSQVVPTAQQQWGQCCVLHSAPCPAPNSESGARPSRVWWASHCSWCVWCGFPPLPAAVWDLPPFICVWSGVLHIYSKTPNFHPAQGFCSTVCTPEAQPCAPCSHTDPKCPPPPHITPGATNPPLHPPQVPSTTTTTTCSGSRDPPGGFALMGRAAQRLPRHHFQLPNVTPPICSSSLTEGPMAFVPLWDGGTSLVKADHGGL